MTKRDANKLMRFMRDWQQRLGLGGWRLNLEIYERPELPPGVFPDSDFAIGHVAPWEAMGSATLHVAEDAVDLSPEDIVLHELLHLVLHEMWQTHKRLEEHVAPPAWHIANGAYVDADELAVNRLVRALTAEAGGERREAGNDGDEDGGSEGGAS